MGGIIAARGPMTCLTETSGGRNWMLASASKIKPVHGAGARAVPRCLTFQQWVGQRKQRANWVFVSGVSLVSGNLELTLRESSRQGKVAGTRAPLRQVRQTSGCRAFWVRRRGEIQVSHRDTRA